MRRPSASRRAEVTADSRTTDQAYRTVYPAGARMKLYTASLAALFVELLLIRWVSSEVPTLAYFKNFPLFAAFIGLGIGCLLADAVASYWTASLWSLTGISLCVTFSDVFGWNHLPFPETRVDMWGPTISTASPLIVFLMSLGTILFILACCAFSFFGLGQVIGRYLRGGPALSMYTLDILGSLSGVLLFSVLSFLQTPPYVWLGTAVALLGAVTVMTGPLSLRRTLALLGLLGVAGVTFYRSLDTGTLITRWSPYYLIEVRPAVAEGSAGVKWYNLNVNRYVHQIMVDLSDDQRLRYRPNSPDWVAWMTWRIQYDFPYLFKPAPRSVLIGGAGTGNDVAAAIRNRAAQVTAVEIDPGILALGKRMHPSRPYAPEWNVKVVNADIRSFFRRSPAKYDLIVLSILDSHTALSSLSSLRLDNYVYTADAMREAVAHLTPDGVMCLSFFESERTWLGQRLYNSIEAGTGQAPVPTRIGQAAVFVFGPGLSREEIVRRLRGANVGFETTEAIHANSTTPPATDDWPFLYLNPHGAPVVYYLCLGFIVIATIWLISWAIRKGARAGAGTARPDWPMFFLGGGFLLIETKALAEMALLFGSTWIVNTFVFSGIFIMVLAANWIVHEGVRGLVKPAYVLLVLSLIAWYVFPRAALSSLSYWPRAVVGTTLVVLPLLFAGLIFGSSFATRRAPNVAFGSNLMGAVVGGAAEATSLIWGIRALTLLSLGFYALAWLTARLRNEEPAALPLQRERVAAASDSGVST